MRTVVAENNPELANQMTERILAGLDPHGAPAAPAPEPRTTTPPPDCVVDLPCGLANPDGLVREAEVRELNGYDEEALSKVLGEPAKFLDVLLERAVVRVGDAKPNSEILGRILGGDVDALTVAIYAATYGPEIKSQFDCPKCKENIEVVTDLTKDVPTKRLDSISDHHFTVELRRGTAEVRLPDWNSQREARSLVDATHAEMATVLLKHCVESINDMPVLDESSVRALSAKDRATLVDEIASRVAGPKLQEIEKACPACGEVLPMPLSVAALFWS